MIDIDLDGDLLASECCFFHNFNAVPISINTTLPDTGRGVRWIPQEQSTAVLKFAVVELLSLRFNTAVNAAGVYAF